MTKKIRMGALAVVILSSFLTNDASAKDWVEKVEIKNQGIDVQEVHVRATNASYNLTTTQSRNFKLRMYARAKSGKRVAIMRVEADNYADKQDAPSVAPWIYEVPFRDLGSGKKRTVNLARTFNIPLNKIRWKGEINPVAACNEHLQRKMQQGLSRQQVLNQVWKISTQAYFSLSAIAARPKLAENPEFSTSGYSSKDDSYLYHVPVRCLAAPNSTNQVAPQHAPQASSSNQRTPSTGEKVLLGILERTTISVGIGLGGSKRQPSSPIPGTAGRN